ncbi:hypothetical protein BDF14DRAFT_1743166 [Spinellus fusiger]|nr:hypothetical protein BDF14DRAFT_1743166 [Spinellus fusiger]
MSVSSSLPSTIRLPDDEAPRPHLGLMKCFSCLPSFNTRIELPEDTKSDTDEVYSAALAPQTDLFNNGILDRSFNGLSNESSRFLSRNPFAHQASSSEPPTDTITPPTDTTAPPTQPIDLLTGHTAFVIHDEEDTCEQELMDVPISSTRRHMYDNEPDWTEMEEEEDLSSSSPPPNHRHSAISIAHQTAYDPMPAIDLSEPSHPTLEITPASCSQPLTHSTAPPPQTEPLIGKNTSLSSELSIDRGLQRSPVAAVAHSLLGDKLDDFTEKLAFIKKNIIMSIEDEDDWNEPRISPTDNQVPFKYPMTPSMSAQTQGPMSDPLTHFFEESKGTKSTPPGTSASSQEPHRPLHRRSSSLLDEVRPTIARFMHQIGGEEGPSFSPSSIFAALAGPSSTTTEDMGEGENEHPKQLRSHSKSKLDKTVQYSTLEEEQEAEREEDFEDLFDFSKTM